VKLLTVLLRALIERFLRINHKTDNLFAFANQHRYQSHYTTNQKPSSSFIPLTNQTLLYLLRATTMTMNICISPVSNDIYGGVPASPPPTPRKRSFVHSTEDVPMFFPSSQSVLGLSDSNFMKSNERKVDQADLFRLLSTPMKLKPRPKFGTDIKHKPTLDSIDETYSIPFFNASSPQASRQDPMKSLRENAHLLPPPPFSTDDDGTHSPSTKHDSLTGENAPHTKLSNACKAAPVSRSISEINKSTAQKLPATQRSGMSRPVNRRNSMVARCA
jgi:hypothetical protein